MRLNNKLRIKQKGCEEMTDLIIILIIALIVGLASFYIYKAKKSGKKCIGCPDGCSCGGKCSFKK